MKWTIKYYGQWEVQRVEIYKRSDGFFVDREKEGIHIRKFKTPDPTVNDYEYKLWIPMHTVISMKEEQDESTSTNIS